MSRVLAVLAAAALLSGCERIVYRDLPTAPAAVPSPELPSLRFPQIPERDILVVPGIPTLHEEVNAEIQAMFPGCTVGQRCDGQGYSPQAFFSVLNQRLRARGLWAGQHREGESDEMTVSRICAGTWENYHAFNYGDAGPMWANPVSSPCAGHACTGKGTSYRGNTLIPSRYCQ